MGEEEGGVCVFSHHTNCLGLFPLLGNHVHVLPFPLGSEITGGVCSYL